MHALLVSDARPEMPLLISRMKSVNPTALRIARALPSDLRLPSLVEVFRDVESARDLRQLVELLDRAEVNRDEMRRALSSVDSLDGVVEFAKRWGFRAAIPMHPIPPSSIYHPVETADEIRALASKFQNCVRNYLVNILERRSSFAIAKDGKSEAVVHLIRSPRGWQLEGIYGPRNRRPPVQIREAVTDHLALHGVVRARRSDKPESPWACLRRLAGYVDYHDDWAEFQA
ncbi:hypothetical protein ASD67_10740 [Sphingopyxis sp. Root1497]|nr:hypothetical protein ASD67_10740 [Sphingopyxis sp. Root1497]